MNTIRCRRKDGTEVLYYYHRATGIRLPDDPTDPAFAAKLRELDSEGAAVKPTLPAGTFAALIAAYKGSPEFLEKAEKTRRDYARYLDVLGERLGQHQVSRLERKHVLALRDRYADKPRTANYLMQVLRLLLSFAVDRGWRQDNPAQRPRQLKTGEGHRPWEEDEIAAFRARWGAGTVQRVAFELALNTGQRGEDIAAMTRQHYRHGALLVTQEKTKERVEVPASNDLRAVLDPWLAGHQHVVVLVTETGRPFRVDHFRHVMRAAYRDAGLPADCTTHGLRYTAATILQELGCDWGTIGAVTGHRTAEMVRQYTGKRRKAVVAIDRLNRARRGPADGGGEPG